MLVTGTLIRSGWLMVGAVWFSVFLPSPFRKSQLLQYWLEMTLRR